MGGAGTSWEEERHKEDVSAYPTLRMDLEGEKLGIGRGTRQRTLPPDLAKPIPLLPLSPLNQWTLSSLPFFAKISLSHPFSDYRFMIQPQDSTQREKSNNVMKQRHKKL